MTITIILSILFIHWFADFVCQTDQMAQGKSKNWGDLLSHTFFYSLIWMIPICIIIGITNPTESTRYYIFNSLAFCGITFFCHTITDYYTSRVNSKLWEDKQVHNFFVSIGFDQWLHYIQLFVTYKLLTQ